MLEGHTAVFLPLMVLRVFISKLQQYLIQFNHQQGLVEYLNANDLLAHVLGPEMTSHLFI